MSLYPVNPKSESTNPQTGFTQQGAPSAPINVVVKGMLRDQRLTAVDIADALGLSNDSAYKLLRRSDWRISELHGVGNLLHTNLFALFVPALQMQNDWERKFHAKQEEAKAKDTEMTAMKHRLEILEQENKYLKDMVELAKNLSKRD